jgi:hypothetical protein
MTGWHWRKQKARTIRPELPPAVIELRDAGIQDRTGERIDLELVRPIGREWRRRQLQDYEARLCAGLEITEDTRSGGSVSGSTANRRTRSTG